uniref:BTB domain-containing protein n=1 Tax=Leersia perrieri TaxID=77586 RepID=A0A0D9X409_9ORYZ
MEFRTISTCTTETVKGVHRFEIFNYSLQNMESDSFIRSGIFHVGGFDWSLLYYPEDDDSMGCIGVFLELMTKYGEAWARFNVCLINQESGQAKLLFSQSDEPHLFKATGSPTMGADKCMKMTDIELTPGFIMNDCLVIECAVSVMFEPKVSKTRALCDIEVPPSNILLDFATLLDDPEGADVTFKVGEEIFRAHKVVLAARSPVFKAQFYGPMKEKMMKDIIVPDMQPAVFQVLLHFIYTDSVPRKDRLNDDENKHLMMHLLKAGDRYGLERLKIMCESFLAMNLDVETVSDTLRLADCHGCKKLKEACMNFMIPPDRMDDVVESIGYQQLKRRYPSLAIEVWERRNRIRIE